MEAPPCEGDFDHDRNVDGSDQSVFAADFGRIDRVQMGVPVNDYHATAVSSDRHLILEKMEGGKNKERKVMRKNILWKIVAVITVMLFPAGGLCL